MRIPGTRIATRGDFGARRPCYGASMAGPMGIVGNIDDDGFLRFRHITADHDEADG